MTEGDEYPGAGWSDTQKARFAIETRNTERFRWLRSVPGRSSAVCREPFNPLYYGTERTLKECEPLRAETMKDYAAGPQIFDMAQRRRRWRTLASSPAPIRARRFPRKTPIP